MKILGISLSTYDPSAALVVDGKVVAHVEEERLIRNKHAKGFFPIKSIERVLQSAHLSMEQIDMIAIPWDCEKYDNGVIAKHFTAISREYELDEVDSAYQQRELGEFKTERQRRIIQMNLYRHFGEIKYPEITFVNHHLSHACTAYFPSGMQRSLVLSIDGSGEEIATSWWKGEDGKLELLREIKVPHSLGWYYSAFTEYLGFDAYNDEYKVMGLAAYGEHDEDIAKRIGSLVIYDGEGGYKIDPHRLAMGARKYSTYFPDALASALGRQPRCSSEQITQWHKNCAFAVQRILEEIVISMIKYWVDKAGIRKLCISGGVGLNVKMNGRIFDSGLVDDLFVYPICSDAGQSIGGALALEYSLQKQMKVRRLENIYYGNRFSNEEVKNILDGCHITYSREEHIEKKVAALISKGKIVCWFQGPMESGPRALGARSILADARHENSRDRVNAAIKYRELWRPFCPSMTIEGAKWYFQKYTHAPFMILTFRATERAKKDIPAVVHVDGTMRPQIVTREGNSKYFNLLEEFGKITGIPVLLNTSFNIKGEPIVCTPQDALRTFYATGLDALAIEDFLLIKDSYDN